MKRLSFWIRIVLSVGLLALLLSSIDLQEIGELIARSNPLYIALAYLVAIGDRILMAYKWNILLHAKQVQVPQMTALSIYLKSSFLGLLLPATVGGDALRAYALSRKNYHMGTIVSSIIIERALGFIALFVFVLVGISLSIVVFGESFFAGMMDLFWVFLGALLISLVAIYLSLKESILKRISNFFEAQDARLVNNKIVRKLREIYQSYTSYRENKVHLFAFFVLSLVENLFPLLWAYLLTFAFGIEIPALFFFILIPIVLVLIRLPISLDGFGIQEGAFVYFLGLIGIAANEAFLLGVSSHILALCSILPGGLLYAMSGLDMPSSSSDETAPTQL